MALENKLGITDSSELAREEERISKTRAIELFDTNFFQHSMREALSLFLKYTHSFFLTYTTLQVRYGR